MKKFISILLIFFCCSLFAFAKQKVISWKGKEMGAESSPKWLLSYIEKNNEKEIRKKFEIEKNELIFFETADDFVLENAKYTAEMLCRKKILDYKNELRNKSDKTLRISGMQLLTEYWEQYEDKSYRVYVFYVISI
jgi:hypothetical protein